MLGRSTVGIPTDYAPGGARLVEPYLIANAVQGLDPGAYIFRDGELRLLERGGFRQEAGFLCLENRSSAQRRRLPTGASLRLPESRGPRCPGPSGPPHHWGGLRAAEAEYEVTWADNPARRPAQAY
jgi:hypothetical protein